MPRQELEKTYSPSLIEKKWYKYWSQKDYFSANPNSEKEPYTIVIPPPNVTGMLTVGHVLNNTIQDILIRKARMEGKEACWIPGTDHASIATETKVVEMLKEKGINKQDISREEFLNHAWDWKEKYGGIIIKQLKRLGCSCDWERERFTMDEGYTKAVLSAFVKLYEKGYIYKGFRLVNWCPVSKSAISDEEVIHKEKNSSLWYFRYPIKGSSEFVVVATTRPETMLGDTAVAVNPNDERYKHLVGKYIILPIVGREIPIITDKYVDPEFGTGCVKVTPAHDPNDFQMGERHDLELINIMNDDASMNTNVPDKYVGLSREKARKEVVEDIQKKGFLEKIENYQTKIGFSERGQVPIEFYLSEQWFMKMDHLVKPAIDAVNKGKINFYPKHWSKTYNHWLLNIKDWCISRQLYWGHQIPVWYHKEDKSRIHVSVNGPSDSENWVQDSDVLDTWASSWIWPIGVHKWPDQDKGLDKFYPTSTLVTGPDIIFFWVARMIISGYEFMDEYPFKNVYFTSILRDDTGQKLSKSLGNSPDPFDLFDEYGTDAVRFGVMLMAPQGLDVLFSKERLEIGRNFMNKIWNASRFIQMNIPSKANLKFEIDYEKLELPERWILSRLTKMVEDFNDHLDRFRFNEAAKSLYDFTWNDFCDWYIEISKIRFSSGNDNDVNIARSVVLECLRSILILLHPFAPFISEELWSFFKEEDSSDIIVSQWKKTGASRDIRTESKMSILKDIISDIRSVRSRMNVSPSKYSDLVIRCKKDDQTFIKDYLFILKPLARLSNVTMSEKLEKPAHSATAISNGMELYIPLGGLVNFDKEKERMEKRSMEIKRLLSNIEGKLSNQNFLHKAPESVIERERSNKDKLNQELEKINKNLEMIQ
ncbi:MAG: valine--tRNA ligase [Bacteroidota bacterium]|nr:valine--tRNA ligase [Bacteroidota bacterium]